MTETRRAALKMLGTIGATCAFPFDGDELYGQHVHAVLLQSPPATPFTPAFFTPAEYDAVARLADAIIPATDTPGATGAGVPEYVDRVVSLNAEHQPLVRAGLQWLEREARTRFSAGFAQLSESQRAVILQPVSEESDREARELQQRRFRTESSGRRVYYVPLTEKAPPERPQPPLDVTGDDPRMPARFFRLIKNLTADGYYTSRPGLIDELGYRGNGALAAFPACSPPR